MIEKDDRGITLITVVITIIVILILVSVTVKNVLEENGIIIQANKAGIFTEVARGRRRC